MLGTIVCSIIIVGVVVAWVGGYLDPYQRRLQEYLLDKMGYTKMSYGLKKGVSDNKIVEDENMNKIQDQTGNEVGGLFGKGGVGHGVGTTVSKNL